MKTIKIIIILAISFVFVVNKNNAAIKDSIFATVGEKVITRSDIINEIKILLILNNTAYSQEIKEQLDETNRQDDYIKTMDKTFKEYEENFEYSLKELEMLKK